MWRRSHVSDMSRGRPMDGRAGEPTATDVLSGFHAHFGPLALSYAALALTRLATRLLNCRRKCRAPVTVFYASRSAQHPARCGIARSHAVRCPAGAARRPWAVPARGCRAGFPFRGAAARVRLRGEPVGSRHESGRGSGARIVSKDETARGPVASGPARFRLRDDPRKKTGMAFTRVECYE